MSDRDIHCYVCNKYVGVIRDAKLMKGLKFVCPSCSEVDDIKDDYYSSKVPDAFTDLFGDIFGNKSK